MAFFSTTGEKGQNLITSKELKSRKIVVCNTWTRYVRLLECKSPDTTYWQVEVSDIGTIQHADEHIRSTLDEADKLFNTKCDFHLPAKVGKLSKNGKAVEFMP